MPRAQRSRACQQCRERRVKCDETAGFCQQCRRLGLACSGPLQGSVIIDMTDRVARPRQRRRREPKTPVVGPQDDQLPASSSKSGRDMPDDMPTPSTATALYAVEPPSRNLVFDQWPDPQAQAHQAIAAMRWQHRMPTRYQPSRAVPDALDLMFVSHFVQRMTSVKMNDRMEIPWITHLPNLQEKSIKPALRLSIRATSMAFYATMHRDTTILVDSFKWYTMSLHSQRQSLAKMGSHSMPASEEMLVPIILSLYEVYAGTTTTSMWHHLAAAAKILELRGPSNCKGVAFPLFKAMRVSESHRAMVFNTPSPFSTHDWMTVPFQDQGSNAHQHLTDILFMIPNCISMLNMGGSMRSFFSKPIPPTVDIKPVEERARNLLQETDNWAIRCPHFTALPRRSGNYILSLDMETVLEDAGEEPVPGFSIVSPSSFIALTAATYEAIRLILLMLLMKVSPHAAFTPNASSALPTPPSEPGSSRPSVFELASMSAKHILTIAAYMESTHPVGFDIIRTVFPLVVVGILGPRAEEKKVAQEMLDRWGQMRGMAGLCSSWLQA